MKPIHLWIIAALMVMAAFFFLFYYLPKGKTEIEKKGVKEDATVRLKDSQPMGDGRILFTVTFVYEDAKKKNHMVTNQLSDAGLWESFKENQTVKCYYLPDKPETAYIPGCDAIVPEGGTAAQQVQVSAPHSGALRFLAWTMLFGSLPVWYFAWIRSKEPSLKKPKPPVITRR
jgi:hypothetical protein